MSDQTQTKQKKIPTENNISWSTINNRKGISSAPEFPGLDDRTSPIMRLYIQADSIHKLVHIFYKLAGARLDKMFGYMQKNI